MEHVRAPIDAVPMPDRLPDRLPDRIWGGRGAGIECAVCRNPVGNHQMELELLFQGSPGPRTYRVHGSCYTAWDAERRRRDQRAEGGA